MFEVLDEPDSNISCERRNTTTTPTQALTLMNDEFVLLQARFYAERVRQLAGDDPASQIKTAYRIGLSREPSATELASNLRFLEKQKAYHSASVKNNATQLALTDLCAVVLNLNEFVYIN